MSSNRAEILFLSNQINDSSEGVYIPFRWVILEFTGHGKTGVSIRRKVITRNSDFYSNFALKHITSCCNS